VSNFIVEKGTVIEKRDGAQIPERSDEIFESLKPAAEFNETTMWTLPGGHSGFDFLIPMDIKLIICPCGRKYRLVG
jgi:hypothetical protein